MTLSDDSYFKDVCIMNRHPTPTRITYTLCDNTGKFDVSFYYKDEQHMPKCVEKLDADDGDWVKVYGSMRSFKER